VISGGVGDRLAGQVGWSDLVPVSLNSQSLARRTNLSPFPRPSPIGVRPGSALAFAVRKPLAVVARPVAGEDAVA
jgi:hypothetical protein